MFLNYNQQRILSILVQLNRVMSFLIIIIIRPTSHDDVMKGKLFSHYWPFVRGNHRPPVDFP